MAPLGVAYRSDSVGIGNLYSFNPKYYMNNKTLILGLGNSILSDDRIGLDVAQLVHKGLNSKDYDLIESQLVGTNILDFINGYKSLIVIDSIKTKNGKDGDIYQLSLEFTP